MHCAPSSSGPVLLLINKDHCRPVGISTMKLAVEIGAEHVSRAATFARSRSAGPVLVAVAGEGPAWVGLGRTVIH